MSIYIKVEPKLTHVAIPVRVLVVPQFAEVLQPVVGLAGAVLDGAQGDR